MDRCVRQALKKDGAEYRRTAEKQSARTLNQGSRLQGGPGPDMAAGSCSGRVAYREPYHASGDDG
jgi:hypothetical protein